MKAKSVSAYSIRFSPERIFALDLVVQCPERSTPEKAQHLVDPTVGHFETVKYVQGIVATGRPTPSGVEGDSSGRRDCSIARWLTSVNSPSWRHVWKTHPVNEPEVRR